MFLLSLAVCSFVALATGTDVEPCPGQPSTDLNENVILTPCNRSPCRLKKGTNTNIIMKFIPERDMSDVRNHVTADVFGVKLPFVGVDGNSICKKLETETGEKVSCPLKAGIRYIYKDSFPILSFYPTIEVKVHWALVEGTEDIMCFQVPARIVK